MSCGHWEVLPEFWDAAWSESEVYTVEDMQEIVEFAASRGIRVMRLAFSKPGGPS